MVNQTEVFLFLFCGAQITLETYDWIKHRSNTLRVEQSKLLNEKNTLKKKVIVNTIGTSLIVSLIHQLLLCSAFAIVVAVVWKQLN